ncbi:MAG: AraC family transcriptional regulator [Niabella sp.]
MDISIASFGSKQSGDYLSQHFLLSDTRQDFLSLSPGIPVVIHDVVFGICLKGKAALSVNLATYPIKKNDSIILLPGSILEYKEENISDGFLLKFISFSLEFVNSLELPGLFTGIKQNPCVSCTAAEANQLLKIYADLEEKNNREEPSYKKEIIQYTLMAAIYEFYAVFEQKVQVLKERNKDAEFQAAFFDLVYAHYREQHQLRFYAERLFLSPKYLASKIKTLTNRSANDWINEFLILESKSLLASTNKTIKEIAYGLGFPDASTFGKFFKKYEGVNPKQYRGN